MITFLTKFTARKKVRTRIFAVFDGNSGIKRSSWITIGFPYESRYQCDWTQRNHFVQKSVFKNFFEYKTTTETLKYYHEPMPQRGNSDII